MSVPKLPKPSSSWASRYDRLLPVIEYFTACCQMMAGNELGRPVEAASQKPIRRKISGSDDAIEFCYQHFARLAKD